MREDQYVRLQQIAETLVDVAIEELDNTKWPGAKTPIDQHDAKIRGDRYWFKKNGVATLAVVDRIARIIDRIQLNSNAGHSAGTAHDSEDELEKELASTEKEAANFLNKLSDRQAIKARYDKKLNIK